MQNNGAGLNSSGTYMFLFFSFGLQWSKYWWCCYCSKGGWGQFDYPYYFCYADLREEGISDNQGCIWFKTHLYSLKLY